MRVPLFVAVCLCVAASSGLALADDQAGPISQETITLSQTDWHALQERLASLEAEVGALREQLGAGAPQTPPTAPAEVTEAAPATPDAEGAPAAAGGRHLALPDISLIVQAKGKVSSDRRDDARNRVRLCEAELAIQGYVYPNVKADAFIAMSPAEDACAQAEEAYLTYLGLGRGLNLAVGKRLVGFGRTNQTHCHSLLYARRPLVLRNLVGEEGLAGEGLEATYLLPTRGSLFAQLDLGTWTGEGPGESSDLPDIVAGPGAGFADRFNTARLWASCPLTDSSELECGGSYGRGAADGLAVTGSGHATLTGLDLTYRRFGEGASRLLLRGEAIWRREAAEATASAKGYYLFGNWRQTKDASLGLLYDWSQLPQAPDLHESAVSLIWTKQFSEQYYLRLQGTHGSRPGDGSYNEAWLQWVWGVGPHTHNLE